MPSLMTGHHRNGSDSGWLAHPDAGPAIPLLKIGVTMFAQDAANPDANLGLRAFSLGPVDRDAFADLSHEFGCDDAEF